MKKESINEVALVMLIKSNWQEFVEYSGSEESAEITLNLLKNVTGMTRKAGESFEDKEKW